MIIRENKKLQLNKNKCTRYLNLSQQNNFLIIDTCSLKWIIIRLSLKCDDFTNSSSNLLFHVGIISLLSFINGCDSRQL